MGVFVKNLEEAYERIKLDHLIINLFSFSKLDTSDLLEFLELSRKHNSSGKSFVLVSDKVEFDQVPEEITLAPTLQEARDIIDLEEIERDLDLF